MATSVKVVQVTNQGQMQSAITSYIAQGFVIENQTAVSTTMMKKKQFSALWAVVGLILCVIPLLVYLIIYAAESDQMVELRLVTPEAISEAQAVPPAPGVGSTSQAIHSPEAIPPPQKPEDRDPPPTG